MTRTAWILLVALCVSCGGKPETLVVGGYDEQEMEMATERAHSEIDAFIDALTARNGSNFAVKVPIEDEDAIEYFWLVDISYQAGSFKGRIGNDPGLVTSVKMGDVITVAKADISDWMYMRDGKMHGNYTLRPLFAAMSEDEVTRYRALLAEP